ncbi:Exopolyphosphatase [Astathelohania contejeani]|uniref:inorganic diphosphatase n=1 Tax=Astathelohania contejeani TaxID=164912 RepID=A0ABQ7I0V1_9MICR|nr:Exopolyphosphatase [Thelohania contejeani]
MRIEFRNEFQEYFNLNKTRISKQSITISIGNSGCDLDSFISSLVLGYVKGYLHVVNMKKEIFQAKGEMMWLCNIFKINIDDLIFLEHAKIGDNDKKGAYLLLENERHYIITKEIKLALTDHNLPVPELQGYPIEIIIDHHKLENHIRKVKNICIDISVGSATTLVSQYLAYNYLIKKRKSYHTKKNLKESTYNVAIIKFISTLLIIPIIVDTHFLKYRTSNLDRIEVKRLQKIGKLSTRKLKKIRKTIKLARRNDHMHPTNIILQKDYKRYEHLGFIFGASVVKYSFIDWIDRESKNSGFEGELISQIEDFRVKMNLEFFIILCRLNKQRHAIILNFPYLEDLLKINNEEIESKTYKNIRYYKLPLKLSRKLFIPIVKKILKKRNKNFV